MLQIGDKAPNFKLKDQNGNDVRLADYKGKPVLLYFYPKDDSPGCTKEACCFREHYSKYRLRSISIIGVSLDDTVSHKKFSDKYALPFPLLSDTGAVVSKAYGVYRLKTLYGKTYWGIERTSFLIGKEGKIKKIFHNIDVDNHSREVLDAFSSLK